MKFQVPAGTTSISRGEDVFPAADGVADLPPALGRELGFEAMAEPEAKGKKSDDDVKSDSKPEAKGKK